MGTGVITLMINKKYYSAKGENNSHTQFTMHVYHYYTIQRMHTNFRNIFEDLNFANVILINPSMDVCGRFLGMFLVDGAWNNDNTLLVIS